MAVPKKPVRKNVKYQPSGEASGVTYNNLLFNEQFDKLKEYNNVYFFNWNPKPTFYNYDKFGRNDYNVQFITMMKVLMNISRVSKCYALCPEVSIQGKLHCHGVFCMNDKVKYIKSFLPKLRRHAPKGTVITPIKEVNWESVEYAQKDLPDTESIIDKYDTIVLTPSSIDTIKQYIWDMKRDAALRLSANRKSRSIFDMFGLEDPELAIDPNDLDRAVDMCE